MDLKDRNRVDVVFRGVMTAGPNRKGRFGPVGTLPCVLVAGLLTACTPPDVNEFFRESTPHEAYQHSLATAGLEGTRLAKAWIDAARGALDAPLEVAPPYEEFGYFVAAEPVALGYRIELERGQRMEISVQTEGNDEVRLFLELFAAPRSEEQPRLLDFGEGDSATVHFEPSDGGTFLLRVQPELLVDVPYRLNVRVDVALAFPVQDRNMSAVLSYFGDDREGGRRTHHGVDIFAPRHTPVLAVSDGIVTRVEVTNLGGKVVWLRDRERGQSVYYAHLQEQLVEEGDNVRRGDPLGLVGNSGNARTTPPHLHFGVYRRGRGPIDPWHHIRRLSQVAPEMTGDSTQIGRWVRVETDGMRLRQAASRESAVRAELPLGLPLKVEATASDWYRVSLPDGEVGFVAARLTEPAVTAVGTTTPAVNVALWNSIGDQVPIDQIPAQTETPVLGEYGNYLLVSGEAGRLGWIEDLDSQDRDD
ncbi:MAG: peptidoglycan DD-metalloendopeptidase family protein [Longimicrobiales bacterium]